MDGQMSRVALPSDRCTPRSSLSRPIKTCQSFLRHLEVTSLMFGRLSRRLEQGGQRRQPRGAAMLDHGMERVDFHNADMIAGVNGGRPCMQSLLRWSL